MERVKTAGLIGGVVIILILGACYSIYWMQPSKVTRNTGTIVAREFVPSHTVVSYTNITRSHIKQWTAPSKIETRVPDSYRYSVVYEDGSKTSVNVPAQLSFDVNDRVTVERITRWAPIWGTWLMGVYVEKEK